jgi:uncharacterized membrane protein YagU involved in acid resistance
VLGSTSDRRKFTTLLLSFLFVLMAYEMLAEAFLALELWQQAIALGFVGIMVWRLQKRRR